MKAGGVGGAVGSVGFQVGIPTLSVHPRVESATSASPRCDDSLVITFLIGADNPRLGLQSRNTYGLLRTDRSTTPGPVPVQSVCPPGPLDPWTPCSGGVTHRLA